ncbi:hypothetical protein PRK78_004044 [Emydomyces testavorans]|uniref:Uncharacterized protein n=1 Tax=Emydomyces testavorans TaxID=2070801 RepID=A0AAF0DH47_9EURO|nr:hypothetical protein PRK78_004044 [Emydomyces testavorans]
MHGIDAPKGPLRDAVVLTLVILGFVPSLSLLSPPAQQHQIRQLPLVCLIPRRRRDFTIAVRPSAITLVITTSTARDTPTESKTTATTTSAFETQLSSSTPAKTEAKPSSSVIPISEESNDVGRLIAIIVPIAVVVIFLLTLALWCFKRRRRRRKLKQEQGPLYDASIRPNRFRNSMLNPVIGIFQWGKRLSHRQFLYGESKGGPGCNNSERANAEKSPSSGPLIPPATPAFLNSPLSTTSSPTLYRTPPTSPCENKDTTAPMELTGSVPQPAPAELDGISCNRMAELPTTTQRELINIPLSQRVSGIGINCERIPDSSGNEPLSITTSEGVVLAPNLMGSHGQQHQGGATDHVTSFMEYQSNKAPP